MEVKDRIRAILDRYQLSVKEFVALANIKTEQAVYDLLSGRTKSISSSMENKILSCLPDIDRAWLLTGEGEMTKQSVQQADLLPPAEEESDTIMIPIINLDARGGFLANESIQEPIYIQSYMPFSRGTARKGDFVVPVYGDSMSPKYPNGSYVLIRAVELWREYLEYGMSYVLELIDERRLIKNVQRGETDDSFTLTSVNPVYEPASIPKKIIQNVFRVIMTIRRESM